MKFFYIILLFAAVSLVSCSSPRKSISTGRSPAKSHHKDLSGAEREKASARTPEGYLRAEGLAADKRLIRLVDDWLGVPHRIGGKDKSGIDCSGFVTVAMNKVYSKDFSGPSAVMATRVKAIRKNELKEGDLVFFKINGPKVSHVGLYLSDGYFVHATVKKGVMISSLSEPYYEKFYSGSGRVL